MILFHVPSTFILSGASGLGKTTWLHTLIKHKNEMFDSPPTKILYFYGIWHHLFEEMEKKNFFKVFKVNTLLIQMDSTAW